MKRLCVLAAAAAVLLVGCGSEPEGEASPEPSSTTSSATCEPAADETTAEFLERCDPTYTPSGDWPLDPTSTDGIAYLSTLGAVHPDLSDERSIGWGQSLCQDFLDGTVAPGDEAAVLERVKVRFAGGDRPALDDVEAGVVRASVTTFLCPEYA